jgi:hypothetical protein
VGVTTTTTTTTKEDAIAGRDAEHSREDLTQEYSATCNPGPLRETRPSNRYMSELPSPHDSAPDDDAEKVKWLPSYAAGSEGTGSQDVRERMMRQDDVKERVGLGSEQPDWRWIQISVH